MNDPGGICLDGAVHRLPSASIIRHRRLAVSSSTQTTSASPSAGEPRCCAPWALLTATCRNGRLAFAVRKCEIDYRWPARLDDLLEVETRIADIGGASIVFEQTIFKVDDMAATTERGSLFAFY